MNRFNHPRISLCLAIVLAGLLLPAVSQAEIFRWTGSDGRVHFSDHKPAEDTSAPAEHYVAQAAVSYIADQPAAPKAAKAGAAPAAPRSDTAKTGHGANTLALMSQLHPDGMETKMLSMLWGKSSARHHR